MLGGHKVLCRNIKQKKKIPAWEGDGYKVTLHLPYGAQERNHGEGNVSPETRSWGGQEPPGYFGVPSQGQQAQVPFLHHRRTSLRFTVPAPFTVPLRVLQWEHQDGVGSEGSVGEGAGWWWRRWTVLVGSCQSSEELLHLTGIPERQMDDIILYWKKLQLFSYVACLRWSCNYRTRIQARLMDSTRPLLPLTHYTV